MSRSARLCWQGLVLLIMVFGVGSQLSATVAVPVPEIDGSTISGGLACLTGGVLILRALRR